MEKAEIIGRKEKIAKLIKDKDYAPMKKEDIAFLIGVPIEDKKTFNSIIDELVIEGKIVLTRKGKIATPEQMNLVYGNFIGNKGGFGFVSSEDLDYDIFIPPSKTNGAMHKDKVLCNITDGSTTDTKSKEGEIVKILEKGMNVIVGVYQHYKDGKGFVIPDDKKVSDDLFIPKGNSLGAADGHKVVAKITSNKKDTKNPEGKIIEILGHKNDPGVDVLSVVYKYELPIEFPPKAYKELEKIPDEVLDSEMTGRKDLRDLFVITIDGEDTKDVDDAISIEKLNNGNYKLGVHIADVAHYVDEESEIGKEALKRGTSVYLVDRVIPMLPHKLSNGICSLNPNEDRLALSCIMELDKKGKVVSHEIAETIINVNEKMTYDIVADILTNNDSEYLERYKKVVPMLNIMRELSSTLREKRIEKGAIEFGFAESKIILDDKGKPIEIIPRIRNIATSIIEEFMLICNETVAEEYYWLEYPFIYRTHEEPDGEKLLALGEFVNKLGFIIKGNSSHPKSLQQLLASVENRPEEAIISRMTLRSLKQARYSVVNEGHFGLSSKYYCHFTSPIRRFPDLQIHRIIKMNIAGKLNNKKARERLDAILPDISKQCSAAERNAERCERDVDDIKKAQYMEDKIGETFDGIISSITSWGIYVELVNTVEGMVSISNMNDDKYIYNKDEMTYTGERMKKQYSLGDKVKVELTRVLVDEGNIDFIFAD